MTLTAHAALALATDSERRADSSEVLPRRAPAAGPTSGSRPLPCPPRVAFPPQRSAWECALDARDARAIARGIASARTAQLPTYDSRSGGA